MKKALDQSTEQVNVQSLDEIQAKALTERFVTSLSAEPQDRQRRRDVFILVAPTVVSGTGDITGEVQTGVTHRMVAGDGN